MAKRKTKREETINFEIGFFEGILKKEPNFVEALIALGELYTGRGFYEKGLNIDQRLSNLRPEDPIVLYNLACSYSLNADTESAFSTIKRAIKCGYDDFEHLEHDDDLVNLRKSNRFIRYFSRIKAKKK